MQTKEVQTSARIHCRELLSSFRHMERHLFALQDMGEESKGLLALQSVQQLKLISKRAKEMKIMLKDFQIMANLTDSIVGWTSALDDHANSEATTAPGNLETDTRPGAMDLETDTPSLSNRVHRHNVQETPRFGRHSYITPSVSPSRIYINFNGVPISNGRTVLQKDDRGLHIITESQNKRVSRSTSESRVRKSLNSKPRYPQMEEDLAAWIQEFKKTGGSPHKYDIIKKAKELEKSRKFKGSLAWYNNFVCRKIAPNK